MICPYQFLKQLVLWMVPGVMRWFLFPPEDADAVFQEAEVWSLTICTRVPIVVPNDFIWSEGGTEDFSNVIIPKRDERCIGAVTIWRTSDYGRLQDGPKVVGLLVLANSKDPSEIVFTTHDSRLPTR